MSRIYHDTEAFIRKSAYAIEGDANTPPRTSAPPDIHQPLGSEGWPVACLFDDDGPSADPLELLPRPRNAKTPA